MIVTERDKKVIDFINDYKAASTLTIYELFYPSLRVAQNRLRLLSESKILKRDRDHFTNQYYYYANIKPVQIRHTLLLTDFYSKLNNLSKIERFIKEYSIEDVRSDGLTVFTVNNISYLAFVEIELSNTPDIEKYERLYKSGAYKKYFKGIFPLIYYITDKKIPKTNLKVIQINEELKNLKVVV